MRRPIKILAGVAIAGGLLAVALVGNALAQPPVPQPNSPAQTTEWSCHGDTQHHEAMWNALAQALSLQPDELQAQLNSGKSLLDLAKAQGLSEQQLGEAMYAAMAEMMDQLVADGQLTEEEATAMLDAMKSHLDPAHLAAMGSMMGSGGMMGGGFGGMMGGGGGMMGNGSGSGMMDGDSGGCHGADTSSQF